MILKDYTDEVARMLADGSSIIKPDDYPKLVARAVSLYSKKVPRETVLDLESDGSGEFAVSALTGFDQEISGDVEIEHPISTSGEPNLIDRREWGFYRKPAGKVIRLANPPAAGADVRFIYKAAHSITELASTVSDTHFDAVCNLAAAEGCDQIATHFLQTTEHSFVNADVANYQSKPEQYQRRAVALRKKAYEVIGAGDGDAGVPGASVTKNWDAPSSMGGDRLTHPRRLR